MSDSSVIMTSSSSPVGDYYVGVDLGQKKDYSVVAVILKKDRHFTLVHLKQFPLGTDYTQVLEYLKRVSERFPSIRGHFIDQTGVGDVFVEIAIRHGLRNVRGVILTLPKKQEVMTCLKQVMEEKRLHYPRDSELTSQMGDQMAELMASGRTKFFHPSGTHDDKLWAVALAVYGARYDVERHQYFAATGRNPNYIGPNLDWRRLRPGAMTYIPRAGDPGGVVVHGQLWCWYCGRPVLTRPHVCEKLPNKEVQ